MKPILAVSALLLLLASAAPSARAEEFLLRSGGRIVGELLNPDEHPRRQYVVQVAEGAKVTLDAAQVEKVLHPAPMRSSTSGSARLMPIRRRPNGSWPSGASNTS